MKIISLNPAEYLILALYIIIGTIIFRFLIGRTSKQYHSHWSVMLSDFTFPVDEFYSLVKEELKRQGIDNVSFESKNIRDGGGISNQREYLRIKWGEYYYDLGAMPFGKGFYISWWLIYANSIGKIIIDKIPFIGGWLASKLFRVTYYKVNSASAFMTLAHASVVKVIKDITEAKASTVDIDSKPIMNDIFKR